MELLQLKYFKAVAETGKISAAAESLFVSAPAVSTSIARLERELGVRLFDRTGNRITLNRQGEILLRYASRILADLDSARTELTQCAMQQGQHVSIATVASTQWVDMVIAFAETQPQIALNCTSLRRTELLGGLPLQHAFLLASEDDVPLFFTSETESEFLFEDHPVIMVRQDHPLANRPSVDLRLLRGETIFLPMQDFPLYDHLVRMFAECGLPFPAGNAYSHLATQQMVARGLGVAFSTRHTARTQSLPLRCIPISNRYRPWVSRIYWRRGRTFTPDEESFRKFITEYYKTH